MRDDTQTASSATNYTFDMGGLSFRIVSRLEMAAYRTSVALLVIMVSAVVGYVVAG